LPDALTLINMAGRLQGRRYSAPNSVWANCAFAAIPV
jgi:hypothetical protein